MHSSFDIVLHKTNPPLPTYMPQCDTTIRMWRLDKSQRHARLFRGHTATVASLAVAGDGIHFCSGGHDRCVKLWNKDTGGLVRSFDDHAERVMSVAFFPDEDDSAEAAEDGE